MGTQTATPTRRDVVGQVLLGSRASPARARSLLTVREAISLATFGRPSSFLQALFYMFVLAFPLCVPRCLRHFLSSLMTVPSR